MLPRSKEEILEGISDWVERLNEDCGDSIIIVEGVKDKEALMKIGVTLRIVHLNTGMSLLSLLEALKMFKRPFQNIGPFDRVIILTDWDRTGGRLAFKLKGSCRSLDLDCDLDRRQELSRLTRKWVSDVESLDSLYIDTFIPPG
ncbi:MAG: toprim domain-containing protein [Candidatus Thermoplasmatota archaeon]|nr:toprim domain-containing protein [Candidatus Thermoplasmatota archaeon]